jgi:hypothetical protein
MQIPGATLEQTPLLQNAFSGQTFPHAPQFFESISVSVQVLLQTTRSAMQVQAPLMQVIPREQTFPHDPQFWESASVSTQLPLHRIVPFGQL